MGLQLEINDNVVLNYEDLTYKSTILDIKDDCYVINLPLGEGEYLTLEDGAEIELGIVKDNGYYILKSEIINRLMEDGKPFYRITIPVMKKKIERRDFVRISLLDYIFYKTNKKTLIYKYLNYLLERLPETAMSNEELAKLVP